MLSFFPRVFTRPLAVLGGTLTAGSLAFADNDKVPATGPPKPLRHRRGAAKRKGEPVFTRAEVVQKDGTDGRPMWVTYRDGVYDVTEFQKIHPGGKLIKQAAGADVSSFWDVWAYHHHAPKVGDYLEKLRIGSLQKEDEVQPQESAFDPYDVEPVRDQERQTVLTERPYCSETPNAVLGSSYLTSADALYVRNHAPVPDVAWPADEVSRASHVQQHEVLFEAVEGSAEGGPVEEDATMTISQLQTRFGTTTVTSILQCAGNRASEDIAATGASGFTGTPFEAITQGMVGNAQWTGVRLADVLPALYPKECAATKKHGGGEWHVVFEGADGYSASSPLARVLSHEHDCLLATHMNGELLSPNHGYPLRALLPGIAGARNVKWLQSISLQRHPVDAPWNDYYYKNAKAEQIQDLKLQSLILLHEGSRSSENHGKAKVHVGGVAYSGGTGNAIARVEVSADGGKCWSEATLQASEVVADGSHKSFGWVRWVANLEVEVSSGAVAVDVCCRATDTAGTTQSEKPAKERGYLYNGWSKVQVAI